MTAPLPIGRMREARRAKRTSHQRSSLARRSMSLPGAGLAMPSGIQRRKSASSALGTTTGEAHRGLSDSKGKNAVSDSRQRVTAEQNYLGAQKMKERIPRTKTEAEELRRTIDEKTARLKAQRLEKEADEKERP